MLYASKLCTAKEAVKDVTSGDWVDYGWCTGHPVALDKALAERMPELEDVKIRGGIALWRPAILILRTGRSFLLEFLAYVRNRT